MKSPYRAWINQPSTLQPLHHMHGMRCIAVPDVDRNDGQKQVMLYFTEGEVRSILTLTLYISKI